MCRSRTPVSCASGIVGSNPTLSAIHNKKWYNKYKGGALSPNQQPAQQPVPQNPNYDPSSPSPQPMAKPQLEKAFSEYVQQQEEA